MAVPLVPGYARGSWAGSFRRGVGAVKRGAAVQFVFGFFAEASLAINRTKHARQVRILWRQRDGAFQFSLRLRELLEARVGFAEKFVRFGIARSDFEGLTQK